VLLLAFITTAYFSGDHSG